MELSNKMKCDLFSVNQSFKSLYNFMCCSSFNMQFHVKLHQKEVNLHLPCLHSFNCDTR